MHYISMPLIMVNMITAFIAIMITAIKAPLVCICTLFGLSKFYQFYQVHVSSDIKRIEHCSSLATI